MDMAHKNFLTTKLFQTTVYPDFKQKFTLETDASLKGLGAILSQMKEGLLHPVSYASRSLSSLEKITASLSWKC